MLSSPACLSFQVGLWVLCFLQVQVLPLDPSPPEQQISSPLNSTCSGFGRFCFKCTVTNSKLCELFFSLFVQASRGNPLHPVDEDSESNPANINI